MYPKQFPIYARVGKWYQKYRAAIQTYLGQYNIECL